jgi:hypothetical protein
MLAASLPTYHEAAIRLDEDIALPSALRVVERRPDAATFEAPLLGMATSAAWY